MNGRGDMQIDVKVIDARMAGMKSVQEEYSKAAAALLEAEGELKTATGAQMLGINQKDAPENAARFLGELGNPYDAIGADADGRVATTLHLGSE